MNDAHGRRISVELQSQTRLPDGLPFVGLTVGESSILMDPNEARSLGTLLFEFAAGAEYEAATMAVLAERPDDHNLDGQELIQAVGEKRTAMRRSLAAGRPKVN